MSIRNYVYMSCFVLVGFLTGCASGPQMQTSQARTVLQKQKVIYVAQGEDAIVEGNKAVQQALAKELTPYAKLVLQSKSTIPLDYVQQIAGTMKNGYIFYVRVTNWEDHNTPWTTIRDQVSVEISVVNAANQQEIMHKLLEGKGALWTVHNHKPDVVAQQMMKEFVKTLF